MFWHSTVIAAVVQLGSDVVHYRGFFWLKTTSFSDYVGLLPGNKRVRKTSQPWHVLIKNLCMQTRKAA
ncbi:hypothetical protein DPMN_135649 [Dreissena polymorpha]|uniref:Uncharacterized protein n=1 Tax=Dreissena polymorpha TaxID=45954 RepID=A0A9D4G1C8_DREPO|nr:hypothetical protein DPMN_135649 [Dreissena polymorpha]